MNRPGRLRDALPLLGVVAVAVALRLPHLVDRTIWYDEASSWQTASFSIVELFRSVRLNVHMPLYYLLLKTWFAAFGDSVVALRGFSVAWGVATVVLAARFARAVYLASAVRDEGEWDAAAEHRHARSFGLAVALLVACSPFEVLASIEARMYSLGSALAMLVGWQLLRLLQDRRTPRLPAWFAGSCLALCYTHHYGLLTVASAFLVIYASAMLAMGRGMAEEARRLLVRGLAAALVVGLLYLPGLDILRGQVDRVKQDYWIQPFAWDEVGVTFAEFVYPHFEDGDPRWLGWIACGLFAASCAVVARRGRVGDAVVLALAVGPMALSASLSLWTPVWVPRYFRIAHPAMLAVVALATFRATTGRPGVRAALISALAIGLALANLPFWGGMELDKNPGPRAVAARILGRSRPGEWVVVLDLHQYFVLKYYLRGRGRRVRLVKPPLAPFWGPHLIRADDLITPYDLRGLGGDLWVVGNTERPTGLPLPEGAAASERFDATSRLWLHRHVYATRYAVPDRNREENR